MRANVVIDDKLMARAIKSGGYRTMRSTIEEGLRLLLQMNSQRQLRKLRGQIAWEGNLDKLRRD